MNEQSLQEQGPNPNLSLEEKQKLAIYNNIVNYSEHTMFGNRFSAKDYWTRVKGYNPIDFTEEKERELSEAFEELVSSGKLTKREDGRFSLVESQEEIFMKNIAPYVQGRESEFMTESFQKLSPEQKTAIYEEMNGILRVNSSEDQDALNVLKKRKFFLVGEPGISTDNGEFRIGPEITENEIVNSAEEIESKSEEVVDSNPTEVPIETFAPLSADDVIKSDHVVEDMSEVINNANPPQEQEIKQPELEQIKPTDLATEELIPTPPEPTPVVQPSSTEATAGKPENIPELKNSEEWKEFVKLRNDLTKTEALKSNFSTDSGISVEELRTKYSNDREKISALLKKSECEIRGFDENSLTKEQKTNINDYLFEEMVRDENNAYLDALRVNRKETWKDKTKEGLRTVAGMKAISWYLRQNKWTKVAINTGLFGAAVGIGTFVGGGVALTAMGAVAVRGVRGASSVLGAGGGIAADKKFFKQIEKVDEEEKEEVEKIKNDQNLSLEDKTKKFTEAKEKYDKERRWITKRKAMMMVGGGILAGSAAGGILNMAYSGTGGGFQEHRVPRGRIEPTVKSGQVPEPQPVKSGISEQAPKPITPPAEKIFSDPESLKHIKIEGNNSSIWKTIEKGFEKNQQFNELNRAQKDNVVDFFTGKAIKNPSEYGFTRDPNFGVKVEQNQEIDLSKLLSDTQEVKKILKGAAELSQERQQSISEYRDQIATYLHEHPGVNLTNDKVAEILNTKPKVVIEQVSEPPKLGPMVIETSEVIKSIKPEDLYNPPMMAGGAAMAGVAAMSVLDREKREQIHKDIEEARARLGELTTEGTDSKVVAIDSPKSALERSLYSDTRSVQRENQFTQPIRKAFREGIDKIYSKKGWFGVGKVEGLKTEEWGEMDRNLAKELVQYDEGGSEREKLSAKTLKILESPQNQQFIKELIHLRGLTGGVVDPREREHPGEYMMRLSEFVTREQSQQSQLPNFKKAA